MMSTDTLKMDLKLPMGRGTSTESSCLMRPFLRLFRTGKPPGKINYIFYRHIDKSAYNLGSLCYSEGGRILFFPGFKAKDLLWFLNKKGDFKKFKLSDFFVDHFTLESDFKKMHLTLLKKNRTSGKQYPAEFKTLKIDKDIFFWFGLSIQYPSLLEPTAKTTSITLPTPSSDAKRRIQNVIDARKDAIFHILEQSNKKAFSTNEFIHFNFFICPDDTDIPKEHVFQSLPTKEPIVSNFHSDEPIPYRQYHVALAGIDKKIAVTVSRHQGTLKNNILTGMFEG